MDVPDRTKSERKRELEEESVRRGDIDEETRAQLHASIEDVSDQHSREALEVVYEVITGEQF